MADDGVHAPSSTGCCASTPACRACSTKPSGLSEALGARVLLKREDLNHTGAHKIRNVLGQALLTKRMGKKRVIAETGAGQHGVATATACAYFGLECVVYMGEVDTERQALNVARMKMLGAEVVPVKTGSRTLKDAINEALRDWVANVDSTHYLLGTAAGAHPFPAMVRDFTRGIGDEARAQTLELLGALPDAALACVGGGSNAIGLFTAFIDDADGRGSSASRPAATASTPGGTRRRSSAGQVGVLHGARSYLLQDDDGQTIESHSISAGLDYPGVGPEHSWLAETGRANYRRSPMPQAMDAMALLCATEGIIPAIESAHALAGCPRSAAELGRGSTSWCVCPAAATRTWTPPRPGSACVDDGAGEETAMSVGDQHSTRARRRGPGGPRRLPAGRLPDRRRIDRG